MMGAMTEQVYTLVQASKVAGVSMPTIRRRKEQLVEAGAVVDPKGWRIPHTALVYAFPTISMTAGEPQEGPEVVPDIEHHDQPDDRVQELHDRVRRLESENQILRHHVEKWQAISQERLDALNDSRLAFRALAMTQQRQIEPPKPSPAEEPRPGWWRRTFG